MNTDFLHTSKPEKLQHILDTYGVAILDNYYTDAETDEFFQSAKEWMIGLNIGLTHDEKSWTIKNTPLGPRYGMYQNIISHFPGFWKLREDMSYLFAYLYGTDDDLITSIDGASLYPSKNLRSTDDWPHIDQTVNSDLMCYQSQFVTTDTTAAFVATIGSHLKHAEILQKFNIPNSSSNWHLFNTTERTELKKMFGKNYQVPIYANKGCAIFWDSRTIHSSKRQDPGDNTWRGVFYVSMRPKKLLTNRNINTVTRAAVEGRTTNHWGSKMLGSVTDMAQKMIKL